MRILVVSDTHGDFDALNRLWLREKGHTDLLIHLGDGDQDLDDLRAVDPLAPIRHVRGNCDYYSSAADTEIVALEGLRILITHGHMFDVNYTLGRLSAETRKQNANIALYGHTHRQLCYHELGITLMNPGSLSRPRDGKHGFATIEVVQGQPVCTLHQFE